MTRAAENITVFVAGASGTLGRPVVARLLASGHSVRALARSAEASQAVRALGAEAVLGSLFDRSVLDAGVAGCAAVLHLATRIPPGNRAFSRGAWAENDRIRTEGTRLLVEACLHAGIATLLYSGICLPIPLAVNAG